MPEDFEIDVVAFGEMVIRTVLREDRLGSHIPEHWASIIEKARPLVHQLIALNDEMKPNGYVLTGYKKDGKKVLTKDQRMKAAQGKLWGTTAGKCKKGDRVWLLDDYDIEMYVREHQPVQIIIKSKDGIVAEHPYERHGTILIGKKDKVLKAPADYEEKEEFYCSDKYWLEQADELGI
jgi:hypothetical protein